MSAQASSTLVTTPPRAVRLTQDARASRWVWRVGALLVLGLVCAAGWSNAEQLRALRDHGATTTGQITWLHERRPSRGARFWLDYQFPTPRGWIHHQAAVSEADYRRHYEGEPVLVTYLPERPAVARLGRVDGARLREQQRAFEAAALVVGALMAALMGWAEWDLRRQWLIASWGVPAVARVERVSSVPGDRSFPVRYAFTLPGGRTVTGKARLPRRLRCRTFAGDPIAILYHPNRLALNAPIASLRAVRAEDLPDL
ncbi:MAG TPA: DUF3592 domain-containing protein [Armatimonadota bacterium]|nr:DUF3592 domain-containing protein [Armatimonadota bacterium]